MPETEEEYQSLDSILRDFNYRDAMSPSAGGKSICFWVPLEVHELYETVQKNSNHKFGKTLKKIIIEAIVRSTDS